MIKKHFGLVVFGFLACVAVAGRAHSQWVTTVVDPGEAETPAGKYTSMKVVNGNPAVSYYGDDFNGDLRFVRAIDSDGLFWGRPLTLDNGGDAGIYTSLAIVNGNPAISYDAGNSLRYVRATDASGTIWGSPKTLASTGNVGQFSSLAVVGGNPAISYYDYNNGDGNLMFIRAADSNGTVWGTAIPVDTAGAVGLYTSLAVISGNPAISYYDNTNGRLLFVRASDAAGTSWNTPVPVDSSGNAGLYTSLLEVNGKPAISYFDGANLRVKYARATDANGVVWAEPLTADDNPGTLGEYTSLAIVNAYPAISYYDRTNHDLRYVRATDVNGIAWSDPVAPDQEGDVGQFSSLVIVNGSPAVSYFDNENAHLKYIRATDVDGAAWGTPKAADAPGPRGEFSALAVVEGKPAIAYYDRGLQSVNYIRATDIKGLSWGMPVVLVSNAGGEDMDTSLAIVNGNPAIFYHDSMLEDMRYIRALNPDGTLWGAPITIDNNVDIDGGGASLAVVSGNPAVAYGNRRLNSVKYARSADTNGDAWNQPRTVDTSGDDPSMIEIDGTPAIAYTSDQLLYRRANDAGGTSWGPVTFGESEVYDALSLKLVNGSPAILYSNFEDHLLRYRRASDAIGANWTASVPIDSVYDYGFLSLAVVRDRPAVAYISIITDKLSYVRATDANGAAWSAIEIVDNVSHNVEFVSLVAINGNPAISYYDLLSYRLKYAYFDGPTATPTPVPTPSPTPSPTPIPMDEADVADHDIPAQLPEARGTPVHITMRNTGDTTWSHDAGYALAATLDACLMTSPTMRIDLPAEALVPPDSDYAFNLVLTAPADAGATCPLTFQMTHDGEGLFGEALALNIEIVEAILDALPLSDTAPLAMQPAEQLSIGITFRNTGNTAWLPGVDSLKIESDVCGLFRGVTRLEIPDGEVVLPMESLQFIAHLKAPSDLGECHLILRMQEEGAGSFGDELALTLQISEPVNQARDWAIYQ